jgi:HTH-type transcriptional regulator/antitoxin HigA
MELIRRFPLRPVRSEKDLDRATAVIHSLLERRLDPGEREYLDALSDLVRLYEEEHHPIEDLEPPEMLGYLIDDRGISQRELDAASGIPVSTISELIAGKRSFTLNHVERLAAHFKVSPEVFVRTKKRRR